MVHKSVGHYFLLAFILVYISYDTKTHIGNRSFTSYFNKIVSEIFVLNTFNRIFLMIYSKNHENVALLSGKRSGNGRTGSRRGWL
jgi:hypothetical protein